MVIDFQIAPVDESWRRVPGEETVQYDPGFGGAHAEGQEPRLPGGPRGQCFPGVGDGDRALSVKYMSRPKEDHVSVSFKA